MVQNAGNVSFPGIPDVWNFFNGHSHRRAYCMAYKKVENQNYRWRASAHPQKEIQLWHCFRLDDFWNRLGLYRHMPRPYLCANWKRLIYCHSYLAERIGRNMGL